MTLPKRRDRLFRKPIICPVCRQRKVMYRPNAKYCGDTCRVRAFLMRNGRWKGTRSDLQNFNQMITNIPVAPKNTKGGSE